MAYRIQFRRDSSNNWKSNNPILLQGEFGYETDTGFAKIGDGSTVWTSLGYFGGTGPSGPQGVTGPIGPTGGIGPEGDLGPIGKTGPTGDNGPTGDQGPIGSTGETGSPGQGVPPGGFTGEFLVKSSPFSYDTIWASSIISSIPPGASTDPGSTGQVALDSDYLYVCVGSNTWKRTEITGW